MPGNPLDDLCAAIRALSPVAAQRALNDQMHAKIINFNEAVDCGGR